MTIVFFSVLAICLPLGVLWYKKLPPSPIQSDSADHLWIQVFQQQRRFIKREVAQHDLRFVKQTDSTARWKALQKNVLEQGATTQEAQIVVDIARDYRPTVSSGVAAPHWPILIQKGFVNGKRVWVSICFAEDGTRYSTANSLG